MGIRRPGRRGDSVSNSEVNPLSAFSRKSKGPAVASDLRSSLRKHLILCDPSHHLSTEITDGEATLYRGYLHIDINYALEVSCECRSPGTKRQLQDAKIERAFAGIDQAQAQIQALSSAKC